VSTSWGGGRRVAARIVAAAAGLAVLGAPLTANAAAPSQPTTEVVVVGAGAGQALTWVHGLHVQRLANDVAVGRVTAAAEATLRSEGFRVGPDARVRLTDSGSTDAAAPDSKSVRDLVHATGLGDGSGQTVALVDSGVTEVPALAGRVIQGADFTGAGFGDSYGHGTFVAGLIAGNGLDANGQQTGLEGVAPAARIVSVKVADSQGQSTVGQVAAGIAWVIDHKSDYGITVLNLSLSVGKADSYELDPVDALAEAAWFSGIVVVASAGNDGGPVLRAPGNDPYVLTVGSVLTNGWNGAFLSPYSDHGSTQDGVYKPEVTTPGEHVQAPLPAGTTLAREQTVTGLPAGYGQLSGTSMAAGVASGEVALLRAAHPDWTPGQAKQALIQTDSPRLSRIRIVYAVNTSPSGDADAAYHPSLALAIAYAQQVLHTTNYSSVNWSGVAWNQVTWSDITWSDVTWSDATLGTAASATVTWSDVTWSDATGSTASTSGSTASSVTWSDVTWSDVTWSDG
jgi:serine protease AprX